MPFAGFITESQPGRIFTDQEMLDWLASSENNSDFTHAMGYLFVKGFRGDDAFSTTVLTSTCPREFRLKQEHDYFLRLEGSHYAINGTLFHSSVEMTPLPDGVKGFREKRFAKRIHVGKGKNAKTYLLPGKMDEVILDFKDGLALVRDYKTTKSIPKYGKPWEKHLEQLNIYRMILSDYPEPPIVLPDGVEFWHEGSEAQWIEADPVNVGYGEIAYRSMDSVARVMIGSGYKAQFEPVEDVYRWVQKTIPHYMDDTLPIVTYSKAIAPDGFNMAWRCVSYCPVAAECKVHFSENEQTFNPERAVNELVKAGYKIYAPNTSVAIGSEDDF
jgi:hypothetical protein